MTRREPPDVEEMSPRERSRLSHRERRRRVRMVVDNMGVRRIAQALARRRRGGDSKGS